ASRMRNISVPTMPVAPTTPTLIDRPPEFLLLISRGSVETERSVQRTHAAFDVVLGYHARHPDRRRADHLDVDALTREDLEHLRGDAGIRPHPRADERDAPDARIGAVTLRLGLDDDLVHAGLGAREIGARDRERDVG